MRQGALFREAVAAADAFAAYRLEDRVRERTTTARLYVYALRSLDIYGPTQRRLEKILARGQDADLLLAMKGLRLLNDAKYQPTHRDHRVFPALGCYHESLVLVDDALTSARQGNGEVATIHDEFLRVVERVTTGNGMLVQDWKQQQNATNYAKVNLEISRLVAGESIGVYKVTFGPHVRGVHHSHRYLDEHHFLPDPIDGVHLVGNKAARCTQSDIVYIKYGKVHAFRNDEPRERSFLFVSGSNKTGPWDFVQDITTFPKLDFPDKLVPLSAVGGRQLGDMLAMLVERKRERNTVRRLTPDGIALFHDVVCVEDEFSPSASKTDMQYFVAHGNGEIEVDGNSTKVAQDDIFVMPAAAGGRVINRGGLILYQFGRRD
jgi:quercetin dioxygenase-like cupin family protein/mannose-6-phosphate isomerase-like protein (cupin superfamily)